MSGGFAKRPLAYVCYLCGQQYGSQSLLIHIPQCAVKWCQQHDAASAPGPPPGLPATADQLPRGAAAVAAFNAAMSGSWQQDSLQRCPHCSRTFRPDALAVHSRACSADKPLKPLAKAATATAATPGKIAAKQVNRTLPTPQVNRTLPTDTAAAVGSGAPNRPKSYVCWLCGQQYGSKSLLIHVPQCQVKWEQQQLLLPPQQRRVLPEPPAAIASVLAGREPLPPGGTALQAFNDAAFGVFNTASLVPCGACGRTFRPEALAHHTKHCTPGRPMLRVPAAPKCLSDSRS